MSAMLSVRDVSAGYGGRMIVEGVSLDVPAGQIVAVIGHNGAGKSTLLKAVFNLLPGRRGRVRLGDTVLDGLAPQRLLAAGLAYVPQERSTFPKLTIAENLRMGAYLLDDAALIAERTERVLALFPALRARLGQLAGTLSGGEQRMLEIARTLLVAPRAVMLDEPSIGLAPKMVDTVFDTARRLAGQGVAVLVVEQNVRKVLAAADTGIVMEMGRIVLADSAASLRSDDRVARLYLGAAGRAFSAPAHP
ncbi:MAG: ABC transporter ATP-binding protein [Alphaproteobacteria bacterium]|nr:ABC transporter ATP-binding protein [Alphaproteobacteria bacterium]